MAEADNQIIGVIGSSRTPIKVALSEYQQVRTLDIRKQYFDKSSRELKPTTKGISIGLGNYQELLKLLLGNQSMIQEWLEGSSANSLVDNAHADHKNAVEAKEIARTALVPFAVERSVQKSQAFFASESRGGTDLLELNKSHPFMAAFERLEDAQDGAEELVLDLLASFHRAKALFSGTGERLSPDEIFDTLEFNWGLYLKRALAKRGV